MKILNKTVAAFVAAFFMYIHSVYTYGNDQQERCSLFSDIVYQIAIKRDQGWTRFDVRALVYQKFDKSIIEASVALVDLVFKQPHNPPAKEAQDFYNGCLEITSARPTAF